MSVNKIYYGEKSGLPSLEFDGVLRVLAALPPRMKSSLPTFASEFKVLPRNQWQTRSLKEYDFVHFDQGSSSACVSMSSTRAFKRAWEVSGQGVVNFNPYWTYGWINNGKDAGAVVGDALLSMLDNGMALTGDVADGDLPERVWYPDQLQSLLLTKKKALSYQPLGAWSLHSFDEICSALSQGFSCVSGIYVGSNFSNLEADGCAPLPDVIAGGHALEHFSLSYSAKRGEWLIGTANSWSQTWGIGGDCYLREAHFERRLDAYALLAVEVADPSLPIPTDN